MCSPTGFERRLILLAGLEPVACVGNGLDRSGQRMGIRFYFKKNDILLTPKRQTTLPSHANLHPA